MAVRFQFELSDEDSYTLENVLLDYIRDKEIPATTYSSSEAEAIKRTGSHFRENIFNVIRNGQTKVQE